MQVFGYLRGSIGGIACRFFSSPFDQEEAFQEAWLQLYRVRERFDVNRHGEFPAWARQVARNRCLDLLKASRRKREVAMQHKEPAYDASQLSNAVSNRLAKALEEFVSGLRPDQQRFFELCFVRELSHNEVAMELSISVRRSKYLKKKMIARMVKSPALRRNQEGGEVERVRRRS